MPEHDPTRTDRLAAYQRARAAEKAAYDDAVRVIERWSTALVAGRGAQWSPTTLAAVVVGTPWFDVYCPGWRMGRRDRYPHAGPSPARFSGKPRARA
jgi:hypothetical protein